MTFDTSIDEKIKVWAFFDDALPSVFPIAMSWRRRLIKFKKVIFTSNKFRGQIKFVNLICEADGSNFELEFNPQSYLWKLKKVMPNDG